MGLGLRGGLVNREIFNSGMGMEVCCTLGMLNEAQAKELKEAGLTAYNHNLDTSREFYPKVWQTCLDIWHKITENH